MEESLVMIQVVLMHAALQGSAASFPDATSKEVAERAWGITAAAMRAMPPELAKAIADMDKDQK